MTDFDPSFLTASLQGLISNKSSLVQVMAGSQTGGKKPLPEPMMTKFFMFCNIIWYHKATMS